MHGLIPTSNANDLTQGTTNMNTIAIFLTNLYAHIALYDAYPDGRIAANSWIGQAFIAAQFDAIFPTVQFQVYAWTALFLIAAIIAIAQFVWAKRPQ